MNPVFAALVAVAFGLTLIGADASAAHPPAHSASSHKAAHAAKSAKPSSSKTAAKASTKAPTGKAAARAAAEKPGKATKASSRHESARPSVAQKGKSHASRTGPEARTEDRTVKVVRTVKGRKVVVERVVHAGRKGRSHHTESVDASAGARGSGGGIGREAFVPTSPPIPRAEAVRQIQSRNALPPIPAPSVPIPPPRVSAASASRPAVTLPPPAPEVARARALEPAVQAVTPPVEAPRVAPRYAVGSAELSGPEAAAAAAAALSASRASDPAPAPAAPAVAAPAAVVPPVTAPLPAAVPSPAAVQSPVVGRSPKGTPRAYAMDGATFYQGGRKIRVQGLDIREPGMTSEHATQRLQRALDSGSVSVEPVEVDGSGHTVAVVRVNGRNVAETVRAVAN